MRALAAPAEFLVFLALAALALPVSVVVRCGAAPASAPRTAVLPLQRAFPLDRRVDPDLLRARDRVRHARILQSVAGGVVDFSVEGSSDPLLIGLYFTKVKLGSPPKVFHVQIDTGSDVLWVTCSSCSNCPQTSGLGIELSFFDSSSSSTACLVSCSDPLCTSQIQTMSTECPPQSNQCSYSFQYGDGSGTTGHYVSDDLFFDMVMGDSLIANSSAPVVFGCSTSQSGDLTKSDKAIDGIFGFGGGDLSVISQLSSRGITPKVFSHCLRGDGNGGGIMVLGEILEPSIVYSPLVPSQPHYNLNLQSIAINGQPLPIDPAVFATTNNRGTIIDSGTTLTYLVEDAFDPFVNALTATVSQTVTPIISKGRQCFLVSSSFNFLGGATMLLKPEEYLIHVGFTEGAALWCIGFEKAQEGVSILGVFLMKITKFVRKSRLNFPPKGNAFLPRTYSCPSLDLVLKDKIFVYDLARERIGWAPYDCSLSVNVSVTSGKDEFINAGQLSMSSSSRDMLLELLPIGLIILLMHVSRATGFHFL